MPYQQKAAKVENPSWTWNSALPFPQKSPSNWWTKWHVPFVQRWLILTCFFSPSGLKSSRFFCPNGKIHRRRFLFQLCRLFLSNLASRKFAGYLGCWAIPLIVDSYSVPQNCWRLPYSYKREKQRHALTLLFFWWVLGHQQLIIADWGRFLSEKNCRVAEYFLELRRYGKEWSLEVWSSWVTQCFFPMFYPMTSGSFWGWSFKRCFWIWLFGEDEVFFSAGSTCLFWSCSCPRTTDFDLTLC